LTKPTFVFLWSKAAPRDQISEPFIQGMLNRMVHGFIKYGHLKRKEDAPDSIKCLEDRLKLYKKTGNTEWLIDVANFAMMEFKVPRHPKAHYRATGSEESPGYVTTEKERLARKREPWQYKREGD
jgi:hypothetical protein